MAYSVKCAIFLVTKWIIARVSGLVFGNNQRISGPMIREVLLAEKLSDEATEINTSQATSGT